MGSNPIRVARFITNYVPVSYYLVEVDGDRVTILAAVTAGPNWRKGIKFLEAYCEEECE